MTKYSFCPSQATICRIDPPTPPSTVMSDWTASQLLSFPASNAFVYPQMQQSQIRHRKKWTWNNTQTETRGLAETLQKLKAESVNYNRLLRLWAFWSTISSCAVFLSHRLPEKSCLLCNNQRGCQPQCIRIHLRSQTCCFMTRQTPTLHT